MKATSSLTVRVILNRLLHADEEVGTSELEVIWKEDDVDVDKGVINI